MNERLTAKKFQLAIKNGLTPDEMATDNGITEDELKRQLKLIYNAGDGSRAQSIWRQLEANRKKANKPKKAKKKG